MGIHYTSEFWEGVLCDTSPNSQCWLNTCMTCCNGSQFKPINPLHSKTVYRQWKTICVPIFGKKGDPAGQKYYEKLGIVTTEVLVAQVKDAFIEEFGKVTEHFNVKRIQAAQFQKDIKDPHVRVLQIDYAMAYQCELQREIMGIIWTRGKVNILTAAVYHRDSENICLCH